ncbi:hypothetical protein BT69DRAFT_1286800 [Atractiella rhizophila]|nr:hypothetical protein BT69DRAFT_1286800 [Atractiella rhizophila]
MHGAISSTFSSLYFFLPSSNINEIGGLVIGSFILLGVNRRNATIDSNTVSIQCAFPEPAGSRLSISHLRLDGQPMERSWKLPCQLPRRQVAGLGSPQSQYHGRCNVNIPRGRQAYSQPPDDRDITMYRSTLVTCCFNRRTWTMRTLLSLLYC